MAPRKREPVLPGDEYAAKLVKMYKKAEAEIQQKLTKAILRSWKTNTFTIKTLEKQKKEVNKILKDLMKATPEEIENLATAAYGGGTEIARKELKRARTDIIFEGKGINTKAINVYARQIYSRMSDVVTQAGRTTSDIYAALELETALGGAVGGYDSLSRVQRAMQKIMDDKGIVSFIDKSGREWNMSTYVEMLTRTVTTEIYNKAKTQELEAHGEDLVIMSAHGSTCPLCAPWEGKVVSISGKTKGYPSMAEAREAGMLHPNCRHMFSLWIEGKPVRDSKTTVDKKDPVDKNKTKAKPKGAPRKYQCDFAQKLGKVHYDNIRDFVDKCPEEDLKKLWLKYEEKLKVADAHWKGCSHASCENIYITIDADKRGSCYQSPYAVTFHESGHAMDFLLSSKSSVWGNDHHVSAEYKNGLFIQTIKDEVAEMVNDIHSDMKAHKDDLSYWVKQKWITENEAKYYERSSWFKAQKSFAYKAVQESIQRKYTLLEYTDISDMLEGATRGKIRCGVGHDGSTYWKDRTHNGIEWGLGTEAFAEMTSATMSSPESLRTIKEVLPKSYAVYLDIVKDMLKNS